MNSIEAIKEALANYKEFKLKSVSMEPRKLVISWNTYELLQEAPESLKAGIITTRKFYDIPFCIEPNISDEFFYFSME